VKLNFTSASLRDFFTKNPKAVASDVGQRGLFAYMTSTGQITYFAHFRVGSRQIKKTIARASELSVAESRRKAASLVLSGKEGIDLIGDRKREAEATITLGEVFELHKESMIRRKCSPASVAVNEGTFRTRLAKHSSRPLSSITKTDAKNWHTQWRSAGPCAANRAIKLLSILHNFAAKKTDAELGSKPFRAVDMWPEKLKRDVLPFEHLSEWWRAVDALANRSHSAYFKLLLFSGLRRTDAASIKLDDIHADRIHRPCPKGGPRKNFDVPRTPALNRILAEALQAREMLNPRSEYLFPASVGHGHFSGIWHSQVEVGGMIVTPHVLRRTYISAGASIGVNFIVLKALANHVGNGGDVTLTSYIKAPFEDRMASACRIADFIDMKIVGASLPEVKALTWQGDSVLEPRLHVRLR
jgi:integrase